FPDLPQDLALTTALSDVINTDLAFALARIREPSGDIWEEQNGYHYYTQLLQAQALESGAEWLESSGEHASARAARVAAAQTLGLLDGFWSGDGHFYRSRSAGGSADSGRNPDIAVILAVLHAGRDGDRHGVLDPKVQATLTALEELFEAEYPINRE